MFNTNYWIKYSIKYTNSCLLFILNNFKLETEVTMIKKSLLMTEWNKFEVIEPLHFPKGILLYHVVEFSFLKIQYV